MSWLDKLKKVLVGEKKSNTPKQKKKKQTGTQAHRGGGAKPRNTGGSQRRQGAQKAREGGKQVVRQATNAAGRQSTSRPQNRAQSGTQQHRSGSVSSATQRSTTNRSSVGSRSGAITPANQRRQGAQRAQRTASGAIQSAKDKMRSSAQEANDKRQKADLNALGTKAKVRTSGNLKSKDLSSEDYLKLQNPTTSVLRTTGDKKLDEKIGSRTAYSANKNTASRATAGALQGLAMADTIHGGVGTYNKEAKEELKKAKESTAFNVGYGVGQAASVVASPTAAVGRALAKGAFKGGAKSAGKKIAQNAAMDMAAEAPLNFADAVKMSTDENGKVNTKDVMKWMGLNTALTGGAGAAIEAAGVGLVKRNVKQVSKLKAKIDSGAATLKDVDTYNAKLQKLGEAASDVQAAKSGMAAEAFDKAYGTKRMSRAEGVSIARLTAKKNSAKGLTSEEAARLSTLTKKADAISQENAKKIAVAKQSLDTKTAALNTLSKKTGVEYKVVDNAEMLKAVGKKESDGLFIDGVTIKNADGKKQILINSDSAAAHYAIVGHETTHLLSGTKEFDSLKSAVKEFAEGTGEYQPMREQMANNYRNQLKGLSEKEAADYLDEEMTADLVGKYLFNDDIAEDFIRHLANKDRNMLQRVYDFIMGSLGKATSDVEADQLQGILKHFDNAFEGMEGSEGMKFKMRERGRLPFEPEGRMKEFTESDIIIDNATGKPVSNDFQSLYDYLNSLDSLNSVPFDEFKAAYYSTPEIIDANKNNITGSSLDEPLTPEREALRKKWADETANHGSVVFDKDGNAVYKGEVEQGKRLDIVIGGTGSGKSTLANNISAQNLSRIMDSDDIKKPLKALYGSEGKNMDGYVHEESKAVLRDALEIAAERGDNITLPICGDTFEKVEVMARLLKEGYGYNVHLFLNTLPPPKAAARTMRRAASDGRNVDIIKTVFEIGEKPNTVLDKFVKEEFREGGLIDGWAKYSNDVAEGRPPEKIDGTEDVSFNVRDNGQSGQARNGMGEKPAGKAPSGEGKEVAEQRYKLSPEKQTLHGGKGSASEYLSLKKVKKTYAVGNKVAMDKITKQTGWYNDNGKWQFDIDISNMKFANGIKNLAKQKDGGFIEDEIEGIDAVLKNYPDLGDATISFGDTGGNSFSLKTSPKGQLYGIVLDEGLMKLGLPKKEKNLVINDTMSTALQDVLDKIDAGTIKRSDAENYAEELFDDEGIQKLTNQSKKPTYSPSGAQVHAAKKMSQSDVSSMYDRLLKSANNPDSVDHAAAYKEFRKTTKAELDNMDEQTALDRMEELGFHIYQDVDGAINFGRSFNEFKKIILENGDLRPTKESVKQFGSITDYINKWITENRGSTPAEIAKKMEKNDYCDWVMDTMSGVSRTEAAMRIAYFADVAGIPDEDAAHIVYSVWRYTSNSRYSKPGGYDASVAKKFDLFVEKSPAYAMDDGEILYHGVGSTKNWKIDHLEEIWEKHGPGTVLSANVHPNSGVGGSASSWSNSKITSEGFANWGDDDYDSIIARCHNCITGAPIQHISKFDNEQEVLFGTRAEWTLLNFERVGRRDAIVDVIEKAPGSAEPQFKFKLSEALDETPEESVVSRTVRPPEGEKPKAEAAKPKEAPKPADANNQPANRPMELRGVLDRARRKPTADEMNQTAINMINKDMEKYGGDKGFTQMIDDDLGKNMFGKYNKKSREAAAAGAKAELDELGYEEMLAKFLKSDFDEDPYVNAKRAVVLRNEINRMIEAGEGSKSQLYADSAEIVSKMSSYSGFSSHVLNAMKEFATATPEGKIRTVYSEIARLEKLYGSRIPGGKLKIDKSKLEELATATGKRKEELLHEINHDLWEQIPASFMEKMNEIRHCFMLFNAKTHGRNVFGNAVFRLARALSDEMEAGLLKASKGRIAKLEGVDKGDVVVNKVHVNRKEIYDNRGYLENEFHDIYDKSGSRNKYIEMGRPDDVPVIKFKPMQKLINLNYAALEKEDIKGALKPAFNKAYISYCKARCPKGKDLREFMENMSAAQKERARQYAMFEGEYATFRDSCAFSDWLIGKKQTFANKEGKTNWGTLGYRALDAVLEGAIPFVKTPVNVFRRSMDYSPFALLQSVGKLAAAKSAEEFKLGVHQLCTGLTGTGMMGMGYYLASQGLMTVKAGEESGDAYYDRDMGFQDYSLRIPLDGKEYSWTLDWLSPMGMSLFSGAAFQKMLDKEGYDNTAALNMFFACTSPLTDMSFMSSPKDTMQRFMENASRGSGEKETDFAGALAQLIVGDLPKNYVSGFFPQLMAQTAGFIDPIQRDTRSTRENVYVKGWESSARQLAAKVPVLRQHILNPKVNRRGEDVVTGGNIATRLVNAFINPANVKEINENETDRELIDIRNHMDKDSKDYKYFYYNFTGNPSYNLADGRRMTYNEAYTYGKANRIEQNERVNVMMKSDSYEDMTWKMKADEVDDAHWIGTTKADLKTYGANYAMKSMLKNNEHEAESVKEYKRLSGKSGEEANEKYIKYYLNKERILARSHATGDDVYRIKGIAAIESGDEALIKSLDIHKSKLVELGHYWELVTKGSDSVKQAKKTAFKELTDACCRIMARCNEAEVTNPSKGVKSVSAGMVAADGKQIAERVYRAYGHNWNSAQSGGGLMLKYNKDGKYSIEGIQEMKSTLRNQYDTNNSGSVNKEEVINYIDSLGIKSEDEKACLYEVLYNGGRYKNPYKSEIDDHLKWGENRDDEWGEGNNKGGWGRRGRRGWGRGGWGHGGGSGGSGGAGTPPQTASGAINGKITDPFGKVGKVGAKSNLDDVYRKKARKLAEANRKKLS